MHSIINNESYGYSVTTYGDYVVVGNPSLDTYDAATGSYETGSVDIFKYRTI